ncbi:hypothetical protein DsansV1_C21g0169651 [Dioscorea sansibarensis]
MMLKAANQIVDASLTRQRKNKESSAQTFLCVCTTCMDDGKHDVYKSKQQHIINK